MFNTMSPAEFVALRKRFRLNQSDLGIAFDVSLRTIQGIEADDGRKAIGRVYQLAIERLALRFAAHMEDPDIAPYDVREDAKELVAWEIAFAATSSSGSYSIPKRDIIDIASPAPGSQQKRGDLLRICNRQVEFDPKGIGRKLEPGHADRK